MFEFAVLSLILFIGSCEIFILFPIVVGGFFDDSDFRESFFNLNIAARCYYYFWYSANLLACSVYSKRFPSLDPKSAVALICKSGDSSTIRYLSFGDF